MAGAGPGSPPGTPRPLFWRDQDGGSAEDAVWSRRRRGQPQARPHQLCQTGQNPGQCLVPARDSIGRDTPGLGARGWQRLPKIRRPRRADTRSTVIATIDTPPSSLGGLKPVCVSEVRRRRCVIASEFDHDPRTERGLSFTEIREPYPSRGRHKSCKRWSGHYAVRPRVDTVPRATT